MGVVLVGPSGCGKTTIWKVLKRAHERLGLVVKTHIINPKSMPRSQLLGNMNNDTREFSEGVLTASAREVVKEPSEVLNWIICDGDIDPEWIESLNSVLDDNHLLTLPTGERISFGSNVNFIFETSDLSYASPATISRMGMIFLNNEDISMKSLINEWIKKQPEDIQLKLESFIEEFFYRIFENIQQYEEFQIVKTTRVGLIMGSLSQLLLGKNKLDFMVGLMRGFASNFPLNYRSIIVNQIFTVFNERPPVDINKCPLDFLIMNNNLRAITMQPNDLNLSHFMDSNEPPIVYTSGLIRDLEILKPWVQKCEPFIVVGPEGSGKNLLIRTAFNELRKEIKLQIAVIHCNAQTMANQIIQKLNQICLKGTFSKGRIYKPKECSRLILYLKDINLPKPDKYQTIQLIAFLQQIIAHRGFYDENLEFIYLDEKIQIIASMNPASTIGRHELSTRFTAKVRILFIEYPNNEELLSIYTGYFQGIFEKEAKLKAESKKIAAFLVEFYGQILQRFTIDEYRHYLYTPRSLTQVVFGILRYENYNKEEFFYEILTYEINRSFRDRLVSSESQSKFDNVVQSLLKSHLKVAPNVSSLFFSSIPSMKSTKKPLVRLNKPDYISLIQQGLVSYEREFKELRLLLLDEVLILLSFLDRALSGNKSILLAGRSGIGRKSCMNLISLMLGLEILTPAIAKDYTLRDFRKELKHFLEISGVSNKPCLLFIEDHQLIQSEFLELINSLISSGEIPGLFSQEEVDHLLANCSEEIRQENFGKTLYESFCIRIQNNLHIVLSLDNSHEKFAGNCASNPALFTKCEIIWLETWNKDSMLNIISLELKEVLTEKLGMTAKEKEDLFSFFLTLHRNFIQKSASPRHLFSLLETYKRVIEGKINTRGSQTTHLTSGLNKLNEAKDLVDKLSHEAQEDKKALAVKQKEADEALKNITSAMEKAAERKQETEQLQRNLQEEEAKIKVTKTSIEAELKDIGPLVEEAKKAVGGIQKSNLDELKSLKMPPEAIHDVLNAVLRIFGIFDASWNSMKKFLSNRSIIDSILDFDPRVITVENRKEVDKLLKEKGHSFERHVIYRASLAAGPLADWVTAIMKYSIVLEKIRPLEDELTKVVKKLQAQKDRLMQCETHLKELDDKVSILKDEFSARTSEAEILKSNLKKAVEKLDIAMKLLGKLGDEEIRWKSQVKIIESQLKSLPMDSLLASGFMIYLSDADENVREREMKDWKGFMKSAGFEFLKFMSSESQILELKAEGLPGDSLSVENSMIIFNTMKIPLIIDPNVQASEWLKRHLTGKNSDNSIEILNQQDQKFTNQLELAVRFGKILVIQELDFIEPILFPILRKELAHQGPRWVVNIGEKPIDYNPNFRLFLSTRNSYIDIQANSKGLLSVINFTVTRSGLEGKLLSLIINHEQPELEKKKTELLNNEENLKIQLAELEKVLLEELATSSGNILENNSLIESLNQTKEKSKIIEKSLKESSELQESLDEQRNVYRGLAVKGALLYMLINDLQKANNMYRFSLKLYVKLFNKSLDIEINLENQQQKLNYAADNLMKNVYNIIGASLFKGDRLMLGLHMIKGIRPELFEANEWDLFLGNSLIQITTAQELPSWAPQERKENFQQFASIFPNLLHSISLNDKEWGNWFVSNDCEKNFPGQQKAKITGFQRVLLIQTFRPDRVESALNGFVAEALGLSSITGLVWSFKSILKEEPTADIPILFITSQGSDPSKELEEFAEREIGRENFQQLSMGGNQNDLALNMLKDAAKTGKWLCFKNLHLVTSFLPLLEKELKALNHHQNFKLWLTAEPHPKFPAILLESCSKITYEAPPGLKKNLQRIYSGWSPAFFEQGSQVRAQLLFLLAWFHGLLQERRTFIPQGWSKFYEFSYGDFKAGTSIIENLLKEGSETNIQWATLYGLFENAIYGGRIDNEFDLRVLRAYMELYFSNEILFNNKKLSIGISVPNSKSLKEYTILINKLNDNDNPSLFGLPNNIDKAVQRYNTQQIIYSLKILARVSSENLKFDKERWGTLLKPIINMWKALHKQIQEGGLPKIKPSLMNSNDPLEAFVYSEASSAFHMVEKIEESIEGIHKVLFGTGLLTSDIQNEGMELLLANVPNKWSGFWEGPGIPTSWLKAFCKKILQLKKWVKMMDGGNLLSSELNLGDLFHPEIFLNALRQKTARKILCPINDMKLVTTFEQERMNKNALLFKVSYFYYNFNYNVFYYF